MEKGVSVTLTGPNRGETFKALAARLLEVGARVERLGSNASQTMTPDGAALAAQLLSRNGVVVLVTDERVRPQGETLSAEIDPNDTPDFAAEKVLDLLAGAGVIELEEADYSPEEEEAIRQRLSDLGYIE
jgi:hypothetical protein